MQGLLAFSPPRNTCAETPTVLEVLLKIRSVMYTRALIRAPRAVLRPPAGTPGGSSESSRRAGGGLCFLTMYEKYARKTLSNVISRFLNDGFPDLQTERQDALEY